MPDTRMADISEFQSSFDARAYMGGGYSCLIVRAHNGWRKDNLWPARRDYVRQYPFTAVGFYQYLVQSRDAGQQAREFIACVGTLKANEFLVLDLEEGGGNQVPRAEAWFAVVDKAQGFPATLYSGQYFGRACLGGWARWATRPRWMAAYQGSEPGDPHELWQYSSSASFPGLSGKIDASVFHGTDQQFKAKFRGGRVAPPQPSGSNIASLGATQVAQNADGRLEEFVVKADGSIAHRYQSKPGGPWSDWKGFGKP